jgi:hypothetical protein
MGKNKLFASVGALLFILGALDVAAHQAGISGQKIRQPPKIAKTVLEKADPQKIVFTKSGILNPAYAQENIACVQMPNGKILAAWETLTPQNTGVGEAVIYSPALQPLASIHFTNPKNYFFIDEIKLIALENNTVLIAYADSRELKGKFVIVNDTGRVVKGPVVFNDSGTSFISLDYLPGKRTIVLAYQKSFSNTGRGEYSIIGENGEIIRGPIVFNNRGITQAVGTAVTNGLIFLSYHCSFTNTKVMDPFGTVVRDEVQYLVKRLVKTQPLAMNDGNILFIYLNDVSQGLCSILNPRGVLLKGPTTITGETLSGLQASRLKNGNVFISYTRFEGETQKAFCTVLDPNGTRIKELKPISDEYSIWDPNIGATVLSDGRVLIIYGGTQKTGGSLSKQLTGYVIVN